MASIITEITASANQTLLDAAAWAGVSVWSVIGVIAGAILLILILAVWLIERKHEASTNIYTDDASIEFIEKTIAEFPAEMVRIEGKKGKIVIKLISPKPIVEEKPLLPQEVKGEPLPSKVEEAKPPVLKEPKKEEPEPKSEPIAMGAVGSPPKKPEETK